MMALLSSFQFHHISSNVKPLADFAVIPSQATDHTIGSPVTVDGQKYLKKNGSLRLAFHNKILQ